MMLSEEDHLASTTLNLKNNVFINNPSTTTYKSKIVKSIMWWKDNNSGLVDFWESCLPCNYHAMQCMYFDKKKFIINDTSFNIPTKKCIVKNNLRFITVKHFG